MTVSSTSVTGTLVTAESFVTAVPGVTVRIAARSNSKTIPSQSIKTVFR